MFPFKNSCSENILENNGIDIIRKVNLLLQIKKNNCRRMLINSFSIPFKNNDDEESRYADLGRKQTYLFPSKVS